MLIEMVIKTRIIKVNLRVIEPDKIKAIAQFLKKGGIIAYPTDTFYGLGADCFSTEAVKKIYYLKKRKSIKPISIVISEVEEVEKIATKIPSSFWPLSRKFWPGPLTLVLKASSKLPDELLGLSRTIGVRLPALPWLRELVKEANFPITATSANISGEKEITLVEKITEVFFGKIDLVVDAGKVKETKPSTVLDLTLEKPKILREGTLSVLELTKYLDI